MPDAEDLTIDGGQAGDSQPDAVRQFTARFRQVATISNATGSASKASDTAPQQTGPKKRMRTKHGGLHCVLLV